jgi:hypothetical protein
VITRRLKSLAGISIPDTKLANAAVDPSKIVIGGKSDAKTRHTCHRTQFLDFAAFSDPTQ